jgi:hypothetical protein
VNLKGWEGKINGGTECAVWVSNHVLQMGDLAVKDECENPFSVSFFFYMFGQTFPFVMVGLSLAINRMADYV